MEAARIAVAPVQQADHMDKGRPGQAEALAGKKSRSVRLVLLAIVLIGAMAAVHFSPIRLWLQDAERLRQGLNSLGIWVYPVCILVSALLVSCGVPRLVLCGAGSMALGFLPGLLLTQAGTLLGYYCTFLFIRWGGRDWAMHRWPKLQRLAAIIQEQGLVGVILVRQLPLHGTLTNLGLGLSSLKHRHFLIGTAIGLFPEAIPVALAGTAVGKASLKGAVGYLAIAAVAFAVLWIACFYAMRAFRNSRSGSKLMAEAESLEKTGD